MPRKRIGTELKRRDDYRYDFPHQRDIALNLTATDISLIAKKLGITTRAIYYWCAGANKSERIEKLARALADANLEKLRMLEEMLDQNLVLEEMMQ